MGIVAPPPSELALSILARAIADQGLRAAMLSKMLGQSFHTAGIPVLFLKGLVIGQLAYGSPFRKRAWDIDILVLPSSVETAAGLLRGLGLSCTLPATASDATVRQWHALSKESVWMSPDGSLHVELHSKLSDHDGLLRGLDACSPQAKVSLNGDLSLPTLAPSEQFAYLAVHGASSAWFRLKWVADLAGVLHGSTEEQLLGLIDRANSLGAERPARQALLLTSWLFPLLPLNSPLGRTLRRDRLATWLAQRSFAQLLAREPSQRLLGTMAIHTTQLVLAPGWASGLHEGVRQARQWLQQRNFRAD